MIDFESVLLGVMIGAFVTGMLIALFIAAATPEVRP
jgi:hypothetical protein